MANVKYHISLDGSTVTFLDNPKMPFRKVPGTNYYVNGAGDKLFLDSLTGWYRIDKYKAPKEDDSDKGKDSGKKKSSSSVDDNNVSININGYLDGDFAITKSMINNKNKKKQVFLKSDAYTALLHQHHIFSNKELNLYEKTYRFGYFNPRPLNNVKEFLFFTKPDLHIYGDVRSKLKSDKDIDYTYPYKNEVDFKKMNSALLKRKKNSTISLLQNSLPEEMGGKPLDKFNHLLQNQCISNLEVPSLSTEMVDTPVNTFGVGYGYRGSSESSDDRPTFSLEFKDTKFLDVYYYFKAYEEYETLKHHGIVAPFKDYIERRVLHDQISIYKFIVDEDYETILYYGKMYGVVPKSLPRDIFSNTNFDNGLSYTIDFEAAFYEDMKPEIIKDFNSLAMPYCKVLPYNVSIYNEVLGTMDARPVKGAYIKVKDKEYVDYNSFNEIDISFMKHSPTNYIFRLKWKGDDVV